MIKDEFGNLKFNNKLKISQILNPLKLNILNMHIVQINYSKINVQKLLDITYKILKNIDLMNLMIIIEEMEMKMRILSFLIKIKGLIKIPYLKLNQINNFLKINLKKKSVKKF